jgi:hypothetical protein
MAAERTHVTYGSGLVLDTGMKLMSVSLRVERG